MWGFIIFLIALDIFCFIQYKKHRQIEKAYEEAKKNETKKIIENIEYESKIAYGFFKVKNFDDRFVDIETELDDGTCLITENDQFYHTRAKCLRIDAHQYMLYRKELIDLVSIDYAKAKNKTACPICAYNALPYEERINLEVANRKFVESKLIGSSSKSIQDFLFDLRDKFDYGTMEDNQVFFDYDVDKDKVAVVYLSYYNKDEDGEYSKYTVFPNRVIIGYVSSSTMSKIGKTKEEFESLTGILKEIRYDDSDKLNCKIIVLLDGNKLTGVDQYKFEKVSCEEIQ